MEEKNQINQNDDKVKEYLHDPEFIKEILGEIKNEGSNHDKMNIEEEKEDKQGESK